MIKKFISYYKPHRGLFYLDIICAFLISSSDLAYPMVTRYIINTVIPDKNLSKIFAFGLFLLLLYFARMVLEYIVGYYGHILGLRIQYDMRKEIFSHIQKLPISYFDNTKTGHLMSRVTNDLFEISETAHHAPEDLFLSIVKIIGAFILLCTINWQLTLIVFLIIPFMFYFMVVYNTKLENTFRRAKESYANINARIEESISGIRVVKSFTNERFENTRFDEGNEKMKNIREETVKQIGIFDSTIHFLSNSSTVIAMVAGGYFVYTGSINIGDFVAYIIYMTQFLQPLNILLRFVEQYQEGMAGFRRFVEILKLQPETELSNEKFLENVHGEISFKDVSFSYDDKNTVLKDINLTIKKGESVAIVGPSGSGKTTLCNLIPRFYDIDSGSITIDSVDINTVCLESLRKNIGIVQQDVFLFSGSIRENVAYGKLDATDEEIKLACRKANADEFITAMPYGYETIIGERGIKLSGGQKQRLSIARMFLKNPPILILDEATSSLDNKSESIIQNSIEELSKDRTTLIIAHRLATIRNSKRIIVLTENGIEEEGTHEQLIKRKGVYYNLYNAQFESLLIG